MTRRQYNDLNSYLRGLYGERVQKISIDAGLDCPNRDGKIARGGCIYCNAKGSGTGDHARGLSVARQIQINSRYIIRRYKASKFLIYFQSFSNTYAPVEKLKSLYDEALTALDGIVGLSIGTRPDCVDPEKLDLLESYARDYLIWVEYGLQSAHDSTLARINRGHDFACFENAVRATQGRGIKICTHVILGLPGESRADMMETAKQIAGMGVDGLKLHLMYVVKGTKLDKMYRNGKYRCLEQDEYVDMVCEFLEYLPPEMVIQRLTGDPHPDELAAPDWSMDKRGTMNRITARMKALNIYQGKRYGRE